MSSQPPRQPPSVHSCSLLAAVGAALGKDALTFATSSRGCATKAPSTSSRLPHISHATLAWPSTPATQGVAGYGALLSFVMLSVALRSRKAFRRTRSQIKRLAASLQSVAIGQRVVWHGHQGTAHFVGSVEWASGQWIGVELDEPRGWNDGVVFRSSYFQCKPNHGVFCQPADLHSVPSPPPKGRQEESVSSQQSQSSAPTGTGANVNYIVDQRVVWNGLPGTVRFFGQVAFGGGDWVGVELDEPKGMHDGSVFNTPYFDCKPKHGIFCQPSALTSATKQIDTPSEVDESTIQIGDRVRWNGFGATVRHYGSVSFASGEWLGLELDEGKGTNDGSVFGMKYFECKPLHGVLCQPGAINLQNADVSATSSTTMQKPLGVGCKVLWNNLTATVKYRGLVDFAAGEWLGLELDEPKGLHDGSVLGRQYFQGKPKHGVFAQEATLVEGRGPPEARETEVQSGGGPLEQPADTVEVGSEVAWNGVSGVVKYVGPVKFATGKWVGVELDEPKGMHDGSVFGVSYFDAKMKYAVFCQPRDLSCNMHSPAKVTATVAGSPLPGPAHSPGQTAAGGMTTAQARLAAGHKVVWKGHAGVVRYTGKTSFADGDWIGVELEEAKGMHNGSLFGTEYFSCSEKHGIFCQAPELQEA